MSEATFQHDVHHRLETATDARTGTTSYGYFADDQVHTVTTPDPDTTQSGDGYDPQTTTFGYDSAGRQSTVTQPDGTVVNTTYWPTGAVKRTWGNRTYPVENAYDAQGRSKTLTTWQDFSDGTGVAVTTWNYDPQRGFLLNKRYQDKTGPSYSYTAAGRLQTRTWARGVTTTYTHNSAGDLANVDYSDSTPDVGITYDRSGRPKTMTDAAGARTLTYHSSGQLEDEAYTTGLLDGFAIDRSFDSFHRLSGLGVPSVSSVSFSHDAASRLQTVTSGLNTATYSYLANSPLVESVTYKSGGATRLTTTKVYDKLNRLTSITNTPSASSALSAFYRYNAANQRTRVTREDTAYWDYDYDPLGQVTSAAKKLPSGEPMLGHDFGWSFDDIGNRKTSTTNEAASAYTANLLNQYTQRTVPGGFDILGQAQPDATVTVTVGSGLPQPVTRQDGLFFKQITVDNTTADVGSSLTITGVKNNVGPNGEDAVTELDRFNFTPLSPETFSHDADGNLTGDARWTYTWDGENRLIASETSAAAVATGAPKQRIEFSYDGQSRRIAKKVYSWSGGTWVLDSTRLFLYDGWNLIGELDAMNSNAVVRTYVWGLDLSGSLQGAGGVGGLLFATHHSSQITHHSASFDGNGNVIGLTDMSDGSRSAEFEYGAFGEALIADGVAAEAMPIRFSTKYHDAETGFYNYGYRIYQPSTGRWLSKDPIEEEGGLNLYVFVINNPIGIVDRDGLAVWTFPYDDQIREPADNIVQRLLATVEDAGGTIRTALLEEARTVVGKVASTGSFQAQRRYTFKSSKFTWLEYNISYGVIGQRDVNCCITVGIRGGGGLRAKSPPVIYGGAFVLAGNAAFDFRYTTCPSGSSGDGGFYWTEDIQGKLTAAITGALRWERGVQAFGYGGKLFAEAGGFVKGDYDFKSLKFTPDYGWFARGVLEVELGGNRRERFERRFGSDTVPE